MAQLDAPAGAAHQELLRGGSAYSLQGGKRIALLEYLDQDRSIWQAAQRSNLSYPAAIAELDALNNLSDKPLLIRAASGVSSGHGYLTEHGRRAVRLYRRLEAVQRQMCHRLDSEFADYAPLSELLRAITVKTSAGNQLRGRIKALRIGTVNADVILGLGDGVEIFANITNDSVDEMALLVDREATALIKSSFVLLSSDLHVRISARNRLRGTITSITAGAVSSEVRLRMPGGRTIISVQSEETLKDLDLDEGSECIALIKASHVLIAVHD